MYMQIGYRYSKPNFPNRTTTASNLKIIKENCDLDYNAIKPWFYFQCYLKFNQPTQGVPREYPLCAVQMKSRMSAAKDSETCIRRTNTPTNLNPDKYCDALGDKNVIGFFKDVPEDYKPEKKSIILAMARVRLHWVKIWVIIHYQMHLEKYEIFQTLNYMYTVAGCTVDIFTLYLIDIDIFYIWFNKLDQTFLYC